VVVGDHIKYGQASSVVGDDAYECVMTVVVVDGKVAGGIHDALIANHADFVVGGVPWPCVLAAVAAMSVANELSVDNVEGSLYE
jgi:hypothetical protein